MNIPSTDQDDHVGQLKQACPMTPDQTALQDVSVKFQRDDQLQTMVVMDGDRAVGLINRQMLNELFSRPFTRELYGLSKVHEFMISDPLIVEADASVDDVTQIILTEKMSAMQHGFILTMDGQFAGIGYGKDLLQLLSERKQQHLFKLAHFDHLTGLPNRLMFVDRLTRACLRAERTAEMIGLLFIDLDRFKEVNDSLGHAAGDLLLTEVAKRLRSAVRKADSVARLGGDEFTITLEGLATESQASQVADKIIASLGCPFLINDLEVTVTASVGIAVFPTQAKDAGELQRNADLAMYQAKADGKNRHRIFADHMLVGIRSDLSIENDLRQALKRKEFQVYYQPQVDLLSGQIVGVESLLRWNRPAQGLVSPGDFLPLADELGLMDEIGVFVLRETCRQIVAWKQRLDTELAAAVNLTFSQLENSKLRKIVAKIFKESGMDPAKLTLEVTEQTIMKSVERSHASIDRLGRLGTQIAIDDFGTGYSSLSYLLKLPIDWLKIDRCFIQGIELGEKAQILARAILNLADNLGLKVVAEGIETTAQLEFLKRHGCRYGQGFLFSRPLPADDLEKLLEEHEPFKSLLSS